MDKNRLLQLELKCKQYQKIHKKSKNIFAKYLNSGILSNIKVIKLPSFKIRLPSFNLRFRPLFYTIFFTLISYTLYNFKNRVLTNLQIIQDIGVVEYLKKVYWQNLFNEENATFEKSEYVYFETNNSNISNQIIEDTSTEKNILELNNDIDFDKYVLLDYQEKEPDIQYSSIEELPKGPEEYIVCISNETPKAQEIIEFIENREEIDSNVSENKPLFRKIEKVEISEDVNIKEQNQTQIDEWDEIYIFNETPDMNTSIQEDTTIEKNISKPKEKLREIIVKGIPRREIVVDEFQDEDIPLNPLEKAIIADIANLKLPSISPKMIEDETKKQDNIMQNETNDSIEVVKFIPELKPLKKREIISPPKEFLAQNESNFSQSPKQHFQPIAPQQIQSSHQQKSKQIEIDESWNMFQLFQPIDSQELQNSDKQLTKNIDPVFGEILSEIPNIERPTSTTNTMSEEKKEKPIPNTIPEEKRVTPISNTTPEEKRVTPVPNTMPEEKRAKPIPNTIPEEKRETKKENRYNTIYLSPILNLQ